MIAMVESKIIEHGQLKVFSDGKVERLNKLNGVFEPVAPFVFKSQRAQKLMTCYQWRGKQIHLYVDRLVYQAFSKNVPSNFRVKHVDGDYRNCDINNLRQLNYQDYMNAVAKGKLTRDKNFGHSCKRCGKRITRKNVYCNSCQKIVNKALHQQQKLKEIKNDLQKYDVLKMTAKQQKVFELRKTGMTYQEIAKQIGTTYQNAQNMLESLKSRASRIDSKLQSLDDSVLSHNIKMMRIAKGTNQYQFGKAFGVSGSAVCAWEAGRSTPTIKTLTTICNVCGVSIGKILSERFDYRLMEGAQQDDIK
ncbi:helix-turn-helix domain-containing protein [Pediococcus ethanolidurans]|nr:helix-turn-helix domain-containing protein [Pediococcus ethanolidurans]